MSIKLNSGDTLSYLILSYQIVNDKLLVNFILRDPGGILSNRGVGVFFVTRYWPF